ncbi:PREDICTED: trichohyalin-like [Chrysochloris asiatica]|uniref:Trichohyalin-like n=1 Tax=Chrysochloris asiatica TaxID=185453 RepID=A0A9B0U3Z3_CHRAS|nr:PREDICTED: trichohyalin-like [Chrysochloris asiatica]
MPSSSTVCRDFAVLEDHTLAHSLQEQEIEHHLASNVQRNRLVQHDLQVAKQLQAEDLKAQAQLQKRYKDLEQQDCEIAQEIQEKLTIEAERRRIQEKKDEDIARILQEKELQEEKRRKKHFPESSGASAYGDSYYYEDGDQPRSRRARELGSEFWRTCRVKHDETPVKQRKEKPKIPLDSLEELENCSPEQFPSSCHWSKTRDSPQVHTEQHEKKRCGRERLQRSPLPSISGEVFLNIEADDGEDNRKHRTRNWEKPCQHQDRLSPKTSQKAGFHCKEVVYGRDNGQGEHRERRRRPRTPPFSESEKRFHHNDPGTKPRGVKEAVSTPSRVTHRDQEWYDAEIARKLQEEELLATQVDMRAAQVAQDEEIARLLMAEEKKAYKKSKDREKSSLDKRKYDTECKPKAAKSAHPKSKESVEPHRFRSDRPARPPPPAMTDAEDLEYTHFANQHNSTRHFSKSESSHKASEIPVGYNFSSCKLISEAKCLISEITVLSLALKVALRTAQVVLAHDFMEENEKCGAGDFPATWELEVDITDLQHPSVLMPPFLASYTSESIHLCKLEMTHAAVDADKFQVHGPDVRLEASPDSVASGAGEPKMFGRSDGRLLTAEAIESKVCM